MLYAFSESTVFFCIALFFWYGAFLVSRQEFSTFQFFVGLIVRCFSILRLPCLADTLISPLCSVLFK